MNDASMTEPKPGNGRIKDALTATPTDLAELHSATAKIGVGFFLLLPNTNFTWPQPLLSSPPILAAVLIGFGVLHAIAALTNRGRGLRTVLAFIGVLLWSGLTAMAWLATPLLTVGIIFFPLQAIICAWIWLRRTHAMGPRGRLP
jgi:hypothetical protein